MLTIKILGGFKMSFKKAILVGAVTSSVITTTAMGMTHFYARSGRDGAKVFTEAKFSNMPGDGSYGSWNWIY